MSESSYLKEAAYDSFDQFWAEHFAEVLDQSDAFKSLAKASYLAGYMDGCEIGTRRASNEILKRVATLR